MFAQSNLALLVKRALSKIVGDLLVSSVFLAN